MLIRFMGDVPIMEPELEEVNGFMGGIIEDVANYRSESGSIGFSFRFYVEGIIRHPDIKMIAIDGVAPTVENIKNGTYPIIAPVYAVTYVGNDNPNVQRLIDWMLTEEGQYIVEKTGYAGVGKDKES
jgi:phosphate transport system substrate-binding protein